MYYVYILVCSDKKHMKIGVSSKDLKRVIKHHKTYNILISSSRFIPLTEKRLAYKVESYLLRKIPNIDNLRTEDGFTELRDLKWAKDISKMLQDIKTDPEFSYIDVKRMNYKLYKIDELISKFSDNPLIDENIIKKQYESLTHSTGGSVRKKRWKTVTVSGKNWIKSFPVECLD